jgi:hypothetical protein
MRGQRASRDVRDSMRSAGMKALHDGRCPVRGRSLIITSMARRRGLLTISHLTPFAFPRVSIRDHPVALPCGAGVAAGASSTRCAIIVSSYRLLSGGVTRHDLAAEGARRIEAGAYVHDEWCVAHAKAPGRAGSGSSLR